MVRPNRIFFITILIGLLLFSCRKDNEPVQQIDQIVHVYIDSTGQDMLNNKIPGSYFSLKMNDVNGITDNAPVTFALKKTTDTINYIEYIAGAKRIRIDSSGTSKTYQSKIALIMTKKVNETNRVTTDIMVINYRSTPNMFQVSKVWYNDVLKFTKVEGHPNIVKISK